MSSTVRDDVRAIPFVPAAASTAIVQSRRDVRATCDKLILAIEILRRLDLAEPVPVLEEVVARLEEVGLELSRVPV
jgi:hypothetical protein